MSEWQEFLGEFRKRLCSPTGSMGFVIYFVLVLIGIGGAGIWYSIYMANSTLSQGHNWSGVYESICFFSLTVGCASFAESILRLRAIRKADVLERNFDIFMFALFFMILVLSVSGISNADTSNVGACFYSLIACLISLLLWWLVGSTNPNLNSRLNVDKMLNPDTSYMDKQSGNAGLQL